MFVKLSLVFVRVLLVGVLDRGGSIGNKKEYISTGGVYEEGYQRCAFSTTTNMSKNESFEKNGYLFMPGLICDPEGLYCSPPVDENGDRVSGQLNFVRR